MLAKKHIVIIVFFIQIVDSQVNVVLWTSSKKHRRVWGLILKVWMKQHWIIATQVVPKCSTDRCQSFQLTATPSDQLKARTVFS